jgi:hypothetical protein
MTYRDYNSINRARMLFGGASELITRKMDKINHPTHYKGAGVEGKAMLISSGFHPNCIKAECIVFIEKYALNYHLGNAFKYVYRAGKKDSVHENFEKALWYLNRWESLNQKVEDLHKEFLLLKTNLEIWLSEN